MILSEPGLRSWYPSHGDQESDGAFNGCSPWYCWFVELGYPNLDIIRWPDGEFAIIELLRSPVVPSLTPFQHVLKHIKNVLLTPSFVERYVLMLDLRRKEAWDIYEAKSQLAEREHDAMNRHAEDTAERAKNIIMQTPTLVERVAKEGVKAIDLSEIHKHIPRHQLIGHKTPEGV